MQTELIANGGSGVNRVSFAVPLDPGQLSNGAMVRVLDAGGTGCSPWLSGIRRLRGGERGDQAAASLVQLGPALARDGRDDGERPYYWMGVDTDQDAIDDYDEHIGESAYVVALARALDGQADGNPDPELDGALDALLDKFSADAEIGQLRNFNWQCRSAVMTPTFVD